MNLTNLTTLYSNLINNSRYDYYFTITFKEEDNNEEPLFLDEDQILKTFLFKLHRHLFSKNFIKNNLFLDILLIRETNISKTNDHFHGLISLPPNSPDTISFDRIIKAFQYALNKLYIDYGKYKLHPCSTISSYDIPEFTFNHFQKKYTVDPYSYAPKKYSPALLNILPRELINKLLVNSEDHSFPHNLVPIYSFEDQSRITNYILKYTWKNTDHIAFLKPDLNNDYFNFSTKID